MKFTTVNDVKKWLRGLPLLKRELEMKTAFYKDLIQDSRKMGVLGEKYVKYYKSEVERLQNEIKTLTKQFDRALELLAPEERVIITARYIKQVIWNTIELHVHYSRRQAIRIHNQAIEKLVGVEIGGADTNA